MAEVDFNLTEGEPGSLPVAATVRIEIYDQTYEIRTEGDSEYLLKLAAFVDRRMREISSGTLTVDSLKVAILAALHIADELYQGKHAMRSPECAELLDRLLSVRRGGIPRNGMLQARGMWKDRDDLPDFGKLRREWDRL